MGMMNERVVLLARSGALGLMLGSLGCYSGSSSDEMQTDGASDDAEDESAGPGDEPVGGTEPLVCDPTIERYGIPRVRRLTRTEHDATVSRLLGTSSELARSFTAEPATEHGFLGDADSLRVSTVEALEFRDAARTLATETIEQRLDLVFPCGVEQTGDDACIDDFLDDFGRRAFRRPLESDELTRYRAIYEEGQQTGATGGLRATLEAMLQSPHFLYRTELGDGTQGEQGRLVLTQHEIASALSYSVTGTMPDEPLFAAARAGDLEDPAVRAEHARRLLDTPEGRRGQSEFYRQWLGFASLEHIEKNPEKFPDFETQRESMQAELLAFVPHVLFEDDATLTTLLTADYSFLDTSLAALYGTSAPSGEGLARAEVGELGRAGVLTMPGLLSVLAATEEPSIAKRGLFLRNRLLCQTIPDPPPGVFDDLPEVEEGQSLRDYLEQVTAGDGCQSCHARINGLGFGLEEFDAVGASKELHGEPFDASGAIAGTRDIDGPFVGAFELAERLASSQQVRECVAIQQFRYALGRDVSQSDACSIVEALEAFEASGGDLTELVVATVRSDAFIYRSPEE